MKRVVWILVISLAFFLLLAACGQPVTAPAISGPTRAPLAAGKGGIFGQVTMTGQEWPERDLFFVYAATFVGVKDGKGGFYALQPSLDPQVQLGSEGYFQFDKLKPGKYVLIVGPNPQEGKVIAREGEKDGMIIEVKAGEMTEIGKTILK